VLAFSIPGLAGLLAGGLMGGPSSSALQAGGMIFSETMGPVAENVEKSLKPRNSMVEKMSARSWPIKHSIQQVPECFLKVWVLHPERVKTSFPSLLMDNRQL
jgi:hypothetical protein